jgi:pimeloyl-ACP methyl ester carboxylesterase
MATIKVALEEFPDYGLVLCGHSLGGGVAALLAIMVAEPNDHDPSTSAFVTMRAAPQQPLLLTSGSDVTASRMHSPLRLPSGRPIHVYAYGPPATLSPSLRLATRGLITTVINGQDLVPYLSLGVLRDLQAIALAFKTDTSNAKGEVRQRVWEGLSSGLTERVYGVRPDVISEEDDQWAYAALKGLRASMLSPKLIPPGEVFVVETHRVLQRDAFTAGSADSGSEAASLGRPATRAVLKLIRDVETRFGEVKFGSSMLGDHSPGRYELSLGALGRGVLGGEA